MTNMKIFLMSLMMIITTFVSVSLVTVQVDIPVSLVLIRDKALGTGDRGFESPILQVGVMMVMRRRRMMDEKHICHTGKVSF